VLKFYSTVQYKCVTSRFFVYITFDHLLQFDVYGCHSRQNAKHFACAHVRARARALVRVQVCVCVCHLKVKYNPRNKRNSMKMYFYTKAMKFL
jgi:hypothetical protein